MSEVSTFRLYLLRVMYAFTAVVLALFKLVVLLIWAALAARSFGTAREGL